MTLLTVLSACATWQAPRVECDSQLRPINPPEREQSVSAATQESSQP